jgi:hypothetical protein
MEKVEKHINPLSPKLEFRVVSPKILNVNLMEVAGRGTTVRPS